MTLKATAAANIFAAVLKRGAEFGLALQSAAATD
jgi:hypothetical protein